MEHVFRRRRRIHGASSAASATVASKILSTWKSGPPAAVTKPKKPPNNEPLFLKHVAAVSAPALHVVGPLTLYPSTHVGCHDEPLASSEPQVPETPSAGGVSPVHGGEEIEIPLTPALEADVAIDVVNDGSLRVAVTVDACEVGTAVLISTAIVVVGAAPAPVTPPTVMGELAAETAAFTFVLFVVTT